ncbi:MAG: 5-deoxy-glucuronate isomerase [Trueperaceae bacterium]|nr:MAG: 5-deoxy-glucuronate isomerase [Trueperaceae bacterium]
MNHLLRPGKGPGTVLEATRASVGWDYLQYKVVSLEAGQTVTERTEGDEIALVPLSGSGRVSVGGEVFELSRESVFHGRAPLVYAPPGTELVVEAVTAFEYAVGGAPAEGKYPLRLIEPSEMKSELRGGGPARRQVNHILAHPLPAERLILYEVYVPGGAWSGWPPHCHDGKFGSPYLEETYYYRVAPEDGFAIHRNYATDTDFDEVLLVRSGDLVLVTEGFHPVAAAPGSNVYFLNFLAGELYDDARATPPFDDPAYAWIKDDWEAGKLELPLEKG